ncbi:MULTISPECIES: MarR family winged helix-turn-helix transcriptional regulator [Streptomyces]|uniref:MarR family winged helix-turn-helix transcriptional regulator n=1 Tax=Streptomyces TaxID=1883 RepID=UPI001CCFD712|nr:MULTISPECIES: MarR family transcriptional regulator [Streptomyces]UBI40487.1 MarR family transcriptional regulator [Streptomyces mobaraensis]UKW33069.1 MarR family transcriptional regulator [Streptomyces sp. TYQ1024]
MSDAAPWFLTGRDGPAPTPPAPTHRPRRKAASARPDPLPVRRGHARRHGRRRPDEQRGRERTPLSPARLSERISLSSGATTALLNRLEKAGCVERRRETSDRRVVTLRSSPDVRPRAMRFFGPYTAGMEQVTSRYSEAQLAEFREFVTRLGDAMDSLLTHEYHDVEPGTTPGTRPGPDAAP